MESATTNNPSEMTLEELCELDSRGLFPAPGETRMEFQERIQRRKEAFRKLEEDLVKEEKITVFEGVTIDRRERIAPEIIVEAGSLTWELYQFRIDHIPGFFLSETVGPLWGGCSIYDPDTDLSIFLLRNVFRKKEKWFIYERSELLSHELCHGARQVLHDCRSEEYFAYQTSKKALRRYMGNFFIRERDAILFLAPILLMLGAQIVQSFFYDKLPVWPFWILAFLYPLGLAIRNQRTRNLIARARQSLKRCGVETPEPILFRTTSDELPEIAKLQSPEMLQDYIQRRSTVDLRWQIIQQKWGKPS